MPDGKSIFPFKSGELSELQQQAKVVSMLKRFHIYGFALANGHVRTKRQQITGAMEGVVAGVPDMLIVDPPPALFGKIYCPGVALEMKRRNLDKKNGKMLRPNQREQLQKFAERGWIPIVGYGAHDAIAQLAALGYFQGFTIDDRLLDHPEDIKLFRELVEREAAPIEYLMPQRFLVGKDTGDDDDDD